MKTLFEKMRANRAQLADRHAARRMVETYVAIQKIQQEAEEELRHARAKDANWDGFSFNASYFGDAGSQKNW